MKHFRTVTKVKSTPISDVTILRITFSFKLPQIAVFTYIVYKNFVKPGSDSERFKKKKSI